MLDIIGHLHAGQPAADEASAGTVQVTLRILALPLYAPGSYHTAAACNDTQNNYNYNNYNYNYNNNYYNYDNYYKVQVTLRILALPLYAPGSCHTAAACNDMRNNYDYNNNYNYYYNNYNYNNYNWYNVQVTLRILALPLYAPGSYHTAAACNNTHNNYDYNNNNNYYYNNNNNNYNWYWYCCRQ